MTATITIHVHDDRRKPGTLEFRNSGGALRLSCRCLCRSAGHASNPTRDPLHFRGDTPLGRYALTSVSRLPHAVTGIGTVWIGLDPDDFYDSPARRAELGGRTGLGIHGGRGNALLKPTHGCVRLFDRDIADLFRVVGKTRFTVEIKEA